MGKFLIVSKQFQNIFNKIFLGILDKRKSYEIFEGLRKNVCGVWGM